MSPIITTLTSGGAFARKGAPKKVGATLVYSTINLNVTGNASQSGSGTTQVSAQKSSGTSGWNSKAYSTETWNAPATIEYNKLAGATDNGVSYAMMSFNTDPTTNDSYSSLDLASYPYYTGSWYGYNNGSGYGGNSGNDQSWSTDDKFYLVYLPDGTIQHWTGTKLLHSEAYHTTSQPAVHLDMAFYANSATYNRFFNVRVASGFIWNGDGIDGQPAGYYDSDNLYAAGQ